jgi:hypothetical protein
LSGCQRRRFDSRGLHGLQKRKRQTRRISPEICSYDFGQRRQSLRRRGGRKAESRYQSLIAAALACAAKGRSTIVNSSRLRLKESDRLAATSRTLNALGASIEETKDGLIIEGTGSLKGGRVGSFGDHRIAMTAAIASCICDGRSDHRGRGSRGKVLSEVF